MLLLKKKYRTLLSAISEKILQKIVLGSWIELHEPSLTCLRAQKCVQSTFHTVWSQLHSSVLHSF